MRAFLERASTPDENGPGLELHALAVGERIVAVYGGGAHAGRWSGMVTSFDADPEIAKSSPADLLLMKVIAAQCAAGRTFFDLGVGEARYKAVFCDTPIPLFDSLLPITASGWVFTTTYSALLRAKRFVKQDPRLFAWAKRLRAWRGRAASGDAGLASVQTVRAGDQHLPRAGLDQLGLQRGQTSDLRGPRSGEHDEVGVGCHDLRDVAARESRG